jgi:hypothetical protein
MKDLKIYLIIATTLFAIYIIANLNKPKEVNWAPTFSNADKIPYGTRVLYERAGDIFPGAAIKPKRDPIYNTITEDSIRASSYIIIASGVNITNPDFKQLKKYVAAGNDVFIAAGFLGADVEKELKIKTANKFAINGNDHTLMHFVNPALSPEVNYFVDKGVTAGYYDKFDTLRAVVIGETDDHKANLLKYPIGKGNLYLTPNPGMFTNYSLLKPQGAEWAATALSMVKKTPEIVWDEYYSQGSGEEDSPMRVFLGNAQLKAAYYLALVSLLIFVLYEVKRCQRIIPVIKPLENSTVDFVNVVGQVYYERRDNINIARKKMQYFWAYARETYRIKTNRPGPEFVEELVNRTGVTVDIARELSGAFIFISTHDIVTDQELIRLNQLIEQFYNQSR